VKCIGHLVGHYTIRYILPRKYRAAHTRVDFSIDDNHQPAIFVTNNSNPLVLRQRQLPRGAQLGSVTYEEFLADRRAQLDQAEVKLDVV